MRRNESASSWQQKSRQAADRGSREMISDFEILDFNIQVSACMFFFLTPDT